MFSVQFVKTFELKKNVHKMSVMILIMVVLILSALFFYLEVDRTLRINTTSVNEMLETHLKKPKSKQRVVGIIETNDPINLSTVKSILDQSVRLDDLAVQTLIPVDENLKKIVSVHPPQSHWLRETERNTVIINIQNGILYPYDFIEKKVKENKSQ